MFQMAFLTRHKQFSGVFNKINKNVICCVDNEEIIKRLTSTTCPSRQIQPSVGAEGCPAHDASEHAKRCHVDLETWQKAKPYDEIPGPKPLPLIGNTWRFLPVIGEFHFEEVSKMFALAQRNYGNIVRIERVMGVGSMIQLFDPDDIEMVYKQESVSPERTFLKVMGYFRREIRKDLYDGVEGLLTTNGPDWYNIRSKVNTIMMQPKMIKLYLEPVDEVARDFVNKIKRMRDPNNKVRSNMSNEIKKWSLETIAVMALETRLGCLVDNLPEDSIPQKLITTSAVIGDIAVKMELFPSLWMYVSTPGFKKLMKACNEQIDMAQTFINQAMEKIVQKKQLGLETDREKSVLEKLLDIDKRLAVVMASDMLLGGIDTTSTALAVVLYYLSTNPLRQQRLREEILSILPEKSLQLKVEHLDQLPYLKACIKEAARIYPITPGTLRDLTKDTVLSGYRLPKGTKVLFAHMFLSTSEKQFLRSQEYIPERWLRENINSEISYKNAHPFSAIHFGFGARSCIGRRFADLEMEVAIVNLIRNFIIDWDGPEPVRATSSVNYLKEPLHFVFKDNIY